MIIFLISGNFNFCIDCKAFHEMIREVTIFFDDSIFCVAARKARYDLRFAGGFFFCKDAVCHVYLQTKPDEMFDAIVIRNLSLSDFQRKKGRR